jgi:hypothetical protein
MEHVVRQLLSGPVCASQREAALVRVRFSNGAVKLNPPFSSSRSKLARPHRRCHGRRWRTPASCPAVAMSAGDHDANRRAAHTTKASIHQTWPSLNKMEVLT